MSGQQVGPMAQYSQRERRELLAKIAELEHSLSDAMEQIEAIQGSSAVHMARVTELEKMLTKSLQAERDQIGRHGITKCDLDDARAKVAELEGELHVARHCIDVDAKAIQDCVELQTQLDRANGDRVELARELTGALEIEDGEELERLVGMACGRIGLLQRRCSATQAFLDRANASKLRIQRDSDRESKCERDESEHQCDACARCFQRVSERLDRAKVIIDNVIDAWHESPGDNRGLHEALGMTVDEYNRYFVHGLATPKPAEPRPVLIQEGVMTEIEKSELLAALVGTPHRDMLKGYFMANDALVAQIDAFIAQRGEIHKVIDTMTGTRPGTDDLENPAFRLSRMLVDARPSQEPRPMSEAPRDGTWISASIDVAFIQGEWGDSGGNSIDIDRCNDWQSAFPSTTAAGGSGNPMVDTKSGIVDPMGVNPTPGGSECQEHGEGWSGEAILAGGSEDESDA